MWILYIIIVLLVIIVLVLSLIIYKFSKEILNEYDKELILFIIDMYLSYGDDLDIFPDEIAKKSLFKKINKLKSKIDNGTNNGEKNKES